MNVSESASEHNHTSSSTKIRIIAIRHMNKGTVRAIADVGLGPSLTLKEFKVIPHPGQRAWVSPPHWEWQGIDGKRRFTPLIELTGSLRQRIEQAILEAWERPEGGPAHE